MNAHITHDIYTNVSCSLLRCTADMDHKPGYYLGASINFLMSFTYLFYSGAIESFTAGSGGTHEFQLNFRFNNKERIPCPQKMR